jgi:hypothetical protein
MDNQPRPPHSETLKQGFAVMVLVSLAAFFTCKAFFGA